MSIRTRLSRLEQHRKPERIAWWAATVDPNGIIAWCHGVPNPDRWIGRHLTEATKALGPNGWVLQVPDPAELP